MTTKFPTITKHFECGFSAKHDLRGITTHPDAMQGTHEHYWRVTLIWVAEYNPFIGFQRDEHAIQQSWGDRIRELEGKNLSEMMKLPATAENLAHWLRYKWLPRLSPHELNQELTGVRVTKGGHSCEMTHTEANKRGWMSFGGEVE